MNLSNIKESYFDWLVNHQLKYENIDKYYTMLWVLLDTPYEEDSLSVTPLRKSFIGKSRGITFATTGVNEFIDSCPSVLEYLIEVSETLSLRSENDTTPQDILWNFCLNLLYSDDYLLANPKSLEELSSNDIYTIEEYIKKFKEYDRLLKHKENRK